MSREFKLPDLGEGIHEAEILKVLVAEGDTVTEDQPILEVETDKAVVEIPSPVSGTVDRIHVKEGDVVTVGSVMVTFTEAGEAEAKPRAEKKEAEREPARRAAYEKKEAEKPEKKESREAVAARAREPERAREEEGNGRRGPVPATPATRRMAREMGVDLKRVKGSGPGGRVLKEDVRAYAEGVVGRALEEREERPVREEAALGEPLTRRPVELPDFSKYGPVEEVPLKSVRRKIAINMAQSWSHIPHVTHCDEADVTALDEFIKANERKFAEEGTRLTLTVFTVKAVVSGLKRYPQFNSSLDEGRATIVNKLYYNIGIAVATERGLIVPVIRDADKKSLRQIAADLSEIAEKTRTGKIELEKLQGGTFTITNVGAIGGTGMVPMVNFPEAAILGMARASQKPVVRDGELDIATILPLALSFDHRIADGAEAARFVRHVAGCLEEPIKLLLEE